MQMNRRNFIKAGAVASVAAGVKPAAALQPSKPAKRPNVLYIFDDQHRAVSLPGEVFSQVQSPNIDAFRRANFSMDQCISNFPLCCPYRAVLMSGRYPAENGVVNLAVPLNTSEFTLTKAFKASGYRTSYVGKWHLAGDHDDHFKFIPPGPGRFEVDDWHAWENTNNHYACYTFNPDTGEKIPATDWAPVNMSDQVIGLLKARAAESAADPDAKPWFMMLSYNPPHPPFNPPEDDREANPVNMQKYRPNVKVGAGGPRWLGSQESFHKAMQGYIGGITGIDTEFGRVLKALDETGHAGNTIVIFTSDHGEMMGSQGKGGKILPYDESNRVPFAVRYPGVTPRGGSSDALFAAVDIYPTVCGLAGIPVPEHCSGKDLSGIMRGKKMKTPDTVFLMGAPGDDDGSGRADTPAKAYAVSRKNPLYYRGVRTARYTYAVRENGRWLLFDNAADPYQMKNLAGDPAHKPLMDSFDVELKAWMKKTGDPFVYPTSLDVLSTEEPRSEA
jgi:arylsulfatase A-like enzyme